MNRRIGKNVIFASTIQKDKVTKGQKFIIDEVKRHLQASAGKNRYRVIDAVREMPTFGGSILPYYVSATGGTKYPVNVEEMYIYRDERDGFHNGTVAKVAQPISEAEQIKGA